LESTRRSDGTFFPKVGKEEAYIKAKPYVIGISGGSASGKTTFCGQLADALGGLDVKAFHSDQYFKPSAQRPHVKAHVTGIVYDDMNCPDTIDLPRLRDDLRHSIQTGEHDVVVIEGYIVLVDDEICDLLDLKLFIECRADERIVRRLRRNMAWGLPFDEIANVYLDMVRYRHDQYVEPSKWRADVLLNGSTPSEQALAMVAGYVKSKIKKVII
jgi:uridine kinase